MSDTLIFLTLMIVGTFFLGIYDVFTRKILREGEEESELVGIVFFLSGVLLLLVLVMTGIPEIKPGFWPAFSVTTFLNVFSQLAWFRAFKRADASLISPLRLLSPPLVLLTGFLALGEVPSVWGVLGVLTTIIGLGILLHSEASFTKTTMLIVFKHPGVGYGVAGAVLFALSLPFDKTAVVLSSSVFFLCLAFLIVGLANLSIHFLFYRSFRLFDGRLISKDVSWLILAHSVGGLLTTHALNFSLVAYAGAAKRMWSFWTVLFSGTLLHEKNVGKKVVATFVMILGIVVMAVLGDT